MVNVRHTRTQGQSFSTKVPKSLILTTVRILSFSRQNFKPIFQAWNLCLNLILRINLSFSRQNFKPISIAWILTWNRCTLKTCLFQDKSSKIARRKSMHTNEHQAVNIHARKRFDWDKTYFTDNLTNFFDNDRSTIGLVPTRRCYRKNSCTAIYV